MSDAEILVPNDPGPRGAKDANFAGNSGDGGASGGKVRAFPWERLAFTFLFALVAWMVFWLSLILALASGGLKLFGVQTQENIGAFARKSSQYLVSVLDYVSGESDVKPFPFG
jgi:hypothetical protein